MIYNPVRFFRFINLVVFLILSAGCRPVSAGDTVCIKKHCYNVEVVSRDPDRARGLQHRTELPPDAGMLFIFSNSGEHSFWMKDTLIPLDMIWLDHARRVVHIETDVPPCRQDPCPKYTPLAAALYVLELNAGEARKKGIAVGDQVEFQLSAYLNN
jgi:uncharacterized membrane protein (UPF0127 family)